MGYLISQILGFIDYFGRIRPFTHFVELGLDLSNIPSPLGGSIEIFLESVSMYDLLVGFSIISLILDYVVDRPISSEDVGLDE